METGVRSCDRCDLILCCQQNFAVDLLSLQRVTTATETSRVSLRSDSHQFLANNNLIWEQMLKTDPPGVRGQLEVLLGGLRRDLDVLACYPETEDGHAPDPPPPVKRPSFITGD